MNNEQRSSARTKKYDKITNEERYLIMDLKSQGVTCKQISLLINKNLKTIQSVSDYEKKSEYKDLKVAVTNYCFDILLQNTSIRSMNDKQLRKLVNKTVKTVMPPQNESLFAHLIPPQKKYSNKRRIIDQIVENILSLIQIFLKTGELPNLYFTRSVSKEDNMDQEISNLSYSTKNILQEDSEAYYHSQIHYNCSPELTNYINDGISEIIEPFENFSLKSSNNDMFDESIEQFSNNYSSY